MSLIFPFLINQTCPGALGLHMRGADLDVALRGRDEGWSQVPLPSLDPALDQSILGVRLT